MLNFIWNKFYLLLILQSLYVFTQNIKLDVKQFEYLNYYLGIKAVNNGEVEFNGNLF